jgi:hypothetical protein
MKLPSAISTGRRQAGILLMECMVYLSVFVILLGLGTAAFYFCWDHTRAIIFTADEVESALHAGERWRADVRGATGPITSVATADGELLRIPKAGGEILYRLAKGELRREGAASNSSYLVLAKVKASQMKTEPRAGVTAWRWELEVAPRRQEVAFPLRFTFEAVPMKP